MTKHCNLSFAEVCLIIKDKSDEDWSLC